MRNLPPTAALPAASALYTADAHDTDASSQFLIVGHGQLSLGISTKLSQTVASWEMPNINLQILPTLGPEQAHLLEAIDYVFFLQTCDQQHCRPQIVPVCPEHIAPTRSSTAQHKKIASSKKSSSASKKALPTHPLGTKQLAQKTVLNDVLPLGYTPGQLLHQARRLYGSHPQAWSLNVPAAIDTTEATPNPRIAQALDAIAVFLRCYTTPQ